MGRHAGYIALHSGIATGAEKYLIPEAETDMDEVIDSLTEKEKRKKLVNLIVVAEGDEFGGANQIAKIVKERLPHWIRAYPYWVISNAAVRPQLSTG